MNTEGCLRYLDCQAAAGYANRVEVITRNAFWSRSRLWAWWAKA